MSIYLLSDSHHEGVVNLPQIQINYIKHNIDFSLYEALIFTSKNGIKATDSFNQNWKKLPSYAIGEITAKTILTFGGHLVYTSTSAYGNNFAKELISLLKGKKVLFLRAKEVVSDLENILRKNGVFLDSKVVYETLCEDKKMIEFDADSVFVFTSPSTVKCFFKNYKWKDSFKAVCIGSVTAKALPLHVESYISEKQTIKASIDLAKTLIKQS